MMTRKEMIFFQGISLRTISQARIAPSGTATRQAKKETVREFFSGVQTMDFAILPDNRYCQK